jgi:hypothetical protein
MDARSRCRAERQLVCKLCGFFWRPQGVSFPREFSLAFVALERGDPRVVQSLTKLAAYADHQGTAASHDFMLRIVGRWLALAKARFGDLTGGQALIDDTPMDCRMCVDFRGRIAAMAGNNTDAEKWFAQAVEMAPKLPQVYTDRGQARLD